MITETINRELVYEVNKDKGLHVAIYLDKTELPDTLFMTVNGVETVINPGWIYRYTLEIKGTFFLQHNQYVSTEQHNINPLAIEITREAVNILTRTAHKKITAALNEINLLNVNA